jgi:hypothetical protein
MPDSLEVRSFLPRDRARLVELWATVFPDDPPRNAPARMIDDKLRMADDLLLVAYVGETLVGAIMAGYDGVRGCLYDLAVAPDQRRRGYATRLVRETELRLKAAGCSKINLQVRATNSAVVRFYAQLGYLEEERVNMGRVV